MERSVDETLIEMVKEEVFLGASPDDMYSFVPCSVYETAWVAMIPDSDRPNLPLFPEYLGWLLHNQQRVEEGGYYWVESFAAHDLTIGCLTTTLASLVVFTTWNVARQNIDEGLEFVRAYADKLLVEQHGLIPRWFAIVFPGMLELAASKGLEVFPNGWTEAVKDVFTRREEIFDMERSSFSTSLSPSLALYLEALPETYKESHEQILAQQSSEDGSLFQSPSATASAFLITKNRGFMMYLKSLVRTCQNGAPPMYPVDQDLVKLCLVDHLQRLGCDEHFAEEIRHVMDQIYWNYWMIQEPQPQGFGKHDTQLQLQLQKASLAFHLLRMHGYRVSPSRFCWFIHDLELLSYMRENYIDFLGALYNIYRASHLAFPGEADLEKAHTFARNLLQNGLQGHNQGDHHSSLLTDFQKEIFQALRAPWLAQADHLEHRIYIERRDDYCILLGKSSSWRYKLIRLVCSDNVVELATKSYEIRQSVYRSELEDVKRWAKDFGLSDIGFGRQKITHCYFCAAISVSLPLCSDVRKSMAKCAILVVLADDFYDEEGSYCELRELTEAVQRWEGSLLCGHSRVVFDALDGLVLDIASKAHNQQGLDVKEDIKDIWRGAFNAWFKEYEWRRKRYVARIDEYLEVATISVAVQPIVCPACYLTTPHLPQRSTRTHKITELMMISTRLLNDIGSYQRELEEGKLNMVTLFLKENPSATIEDSIAYICRALEVRNKELIELLLTDDYVQVPKEWKRLHLSVLKVFHILYGATNKFDSPSALLENIKAAFYDPLVTDVPRILHPYKVKDKRSLYWVGRGNFDSKPREF
ncbi:(E,E)-geranyllinalool synthase [Typha angustifolia]|uniref:(E,E)-geranyllinalool synthase n=1 Tax=Typha angustifolia TaxID=59011 RepID=UPI003C2C073C